MSARAHMSGQVPGHVPIQGGPQVSGPLQQNNNALATNMQNVVPQSMDHELLNFRTVMRKKIFNHFRGAASDSSLTAISWHLEEHLFKEAKTREEYLSLVMEQPELRLNSLLKNIIKSRKQSHQISSSSSLSTMIPTPGVVQNGITNLLESSSVTSTGTGVIHQTPNNTGTLFSATAGIGNNTLNGSDGPFSTVQEHQHTNSGFGSGGTNLMSSMNPTNLPKQFPQMIPTPGFNNTQTVPFSSDSSSVAVFSSSDSTVPKILHQKKHAGNQNSQGIHSLGGQNGTSIRSYVPQKASSYGFSNGSSNGMLGLIRGNMQPKGHVPSEGFLSTSSFKQPHFDQQYQQSRNSTLSSQQMVQILDDGYLTKANEIASSDTLRSPNHSFLSHTNRANDGSSHAISRASSGILNGNGSLQKLQHPLHILDYQQNMNFQSSPSTNDLHLQAQQQIQQYQYQPNQPYTQIVQNHHRFELQKHDPQAPQLPMYNDKLRQPSASLKLSDPVMQENTIVMQESLLSQAAQHIHIQETQSHNQLNVSTDYQAKRTQCLGHLPIPVSEGSENLFHPQKNIGEFVNKVHPISSRAQAEDILQVQWRPQSFETSPVSENHLNKQQTKKELHKKLTGAAEAQPPNSYSNNGITSSDATSVLQFSRGKSEVSEDSKKKTEILNKCRWLLFLMHARRCPASKGQCKEIHCWNARELLTHMYNCKISMNCPYSRCSKSKSLINHYRNCRSPNCAVCCPVHNFIKSHSNRHAKPLSDTGSVSVTKAGPMHVETSNDRKTSSKRKKIQHGPASLIPNSENAAVCDPANQSLEIQEAQDLGCGQSDMKFSAENEINDMKNNESMGYSHENSFVFESNICVNGSAMQCDVDPLSSNLEDCHVKQENMVLEKLMDLSSIEVKPEASGLTIDEMTAGKSGKPKIKGVSLTELFTPEQIREHIISLRRWVGQSKAKAEKNHAMERSMNENSCQLCAVERLTFDPPPIYCSPCGVRIKRNAVYFTIGSGKTRHYFCIPCYNEARGDTIQVDGLSFPKYSLEKKRNDEEVEEWWVQCDKCEAWQHQICALFNGRRNDGGQAEYTCPNCYLQEVERGERKPLPQSAVLGAKDLPKTILSDHIEQRLFRRLKQERLERARHFGKSYDEVLGAEGLVVRVVSSIDKKLEVKPRFLEIFQEENYPKEFPYKSKAILLFQKIEGVEVCLFGMYVQEFGSECAFPNQRRVYLSYLDSVKYFRPEIKTITGEALRTFVYHEILIGYLEYCKKRGFTSCYIWACPPLKGEDYILYCHPEIQKTPKSDKLREWYLSMLRKAFKDNIIVELTNLYDHFFTTIGECKANVTAARLPYFDGDYWPGAAEDMINQLCQEEDGRKQQKKGKTKKTLTKRALKAAGQTDISSNASKDTLLMQKLGETICTMKEDFIMVHLQHCCKHCCILMVSGTRWVCNRCKNFQLCDMCYKSELRLEERDRHPVHGREKHVFFAFEITDVATDTKDKDEILESEFFDTRQAFLSLCQGNHYQYDTLRRAKHSSMMVLYHLHNPTAPAFVTTCTACHHDIETGQGWRCELCPDFEICNDCYNKGCGNDHPHKLTKHPSLADHDDQNKEARQQRVLQLRKMLDLLVHASQCRFPNCQYPNCRKVKSLFRHGIQCETRASGGCVLCKKMWYLLQIHARACKESECTVPRCRDLKEHLKRLQLQSDSRRRAAVMEMMRQRAAEVAGNSR